MKTTSKPARNSAEILTLRVVKKPRNRSEDKWTPGVMKFGFTTIPNLLLEAQAKLEISPVELTVLVQVIEHWWNADADPYPAKATIARRLGKSPRQVQRYLTQLEDKGLIKRVARYRGKQRQTSNAFSLDGLVKKLKAVEPEFTKAREDRKLKAKLGQKKVETATAG